MPNPQQRQGNKKNTWKTPPTLPYSKSRGKNPDTTTPALKQVPSTQPRPVSLPTRARERASTEEYNRSQYQLSHAQQLLKTHP